MSIARGKRDDSTAALLAERFPRCFAIYEARRRPLKIAIHADITAALGGTIAWRELRNALCSYILNRGYLLSLRAGPSASISMATSRASRPPTRLTMPERSSCAGERRSLPGRRPRRCRHLSSLPRPEAAWPRRPQADGAAPQATDSISRGHYC
jgi:ProQ/FINO family